jgi:hypothetical protein
MNRTVSIVILGISVLVLAVGILFLCAAAQQPGRLLLAVILLVLGGGLAAWSGMNLRRLRELDPEELSDQITVLADRNPEGEVTLAQVVAELKVPDESAQAALQLLEDKGIAKYEYRDGKRVYTFPGLKDEKLVRKCVFCGTTYSVREPVHTCPNCGGDVQLVRE